MYSVGSQITSPYDVRRSKRYVYTQRLRSFTSRLFIHIENVVNFELYVGGSKGMGIPHKNNQILKKSCIHMC